MRASVSYTWLSKRRKDEDWASFGDALKVLSDNAYADLEKKRTETPRSDPVSDTNNKPSSSVRGEAETPERPRSRLKFTVPFRTDIYMFLFGRKGKEPLSWTRALV